MNAKTNKFPAACKDCGANVAAGKGILTSEWNNFKDDSEWVVRHSDKSICVTVNSADARSESHSAAIISGIERIKKNGIKTETVTDGTKTIYDGRRGYNQVGYLLTRSENTLYLTSRSNPDGIDMSATYLYGGSQSKVEDLLWEMELL